MKTLATLKARIVHTWTRPCSFMAGHHQRLRDIDQRMIIPILMKHTRAFEAIALFFSQRGQEHWNCPCAEKSRDAVLEMAAPSLFT